MRRLKTKTDTCTAILTGDWHLRETVPLCRTDDFMDFQARVLGQIESIRVENQCDLILNSGDLFEHWKAPPELLSFALYHLPEKMQVIYGNHDLPQHNLGKNEKSAVHVLELAERLKILWNHGGHWEQEPNWTAPYIIAGRRVIIWHVMHYHMTPPWPGAVGYSSDQLLDLCDEHDIDLILTGHYHRTVYKTRNGRTVFNGGAITQQTIDQVDHKPCVGLWNAETNTVRIQYLMNGREFISTEHSDTKKAKSERYDAFIQRTRALTRPDLDFEENLNTFFHENKTPEAIRRIIIDALHGDK